ncbi:hypothetical protein AOLI_G00145950 [Acnodon oligacanthus]
MLRPRSSARSSWKLDLLMPRKVKGCKTLHGCCPRFTGSAVSLRSHKPFPYTGLEPRLLGACRGVTSHLLVLHKNLQPSAFAFILSPKSSSMDPSSLCQHPQSLWSSDSEFYSISSPETISPAPSMDFSSSPCHQSKQGRSNKPGRPKLAKKPGSTRSRLKNPSEQRQNASEKEKLRMRDLTKALHHLRTYLPPSVAPAGQTLTKIETLRLTIRYISHLSAQLGLTEEYLAQKKQTDSSSRWGSSPEIMGYFQCRATQGQEHVAYAGERGMDKNLHSGQISEPWTDQNCSSDMNVSTFQSQQRAQLTQPCQVHGYQLVPQEFWS